MRDALRWLGWTLLAALVVLIGVFAYYRVRGPTAEQRAAYARIAVDREPKQGRNAFPVLWYLAYDVAPEEADAKLRAEIADVERRLARDPSLFALEPFATKLPEASADRESLCAANGAGCVAKAMADPDSLAHALAAFPVLQSREAEFERSDFYWNPFPVRAFVMPVATDSGVQSIWLSALALRYANGEHAAALAGVCDNIGAWRRVHRGTNSEIMDATAARNVDAGLRVFADMLAATPHDAPVPAACGAALEAVAAADVDRCAILANQLAMNDAMLLAESQESQESRFDRALSWVLFDREQTRGWNAEVDALRCGEPALERMLRDEPLDAKAVPVVSHRLECISSAIGCMLVAIGAPAINPDRITLDLAAHLRLARTLLWLREGDAPASSRFADRPADLRSGSRASGVDEAARVVFVGDLRPGPRERFELAIAPP